MRDCQGYRSGGGDGVWDCGGCGYKRAISGDPCSKCLGCGVNICEKTV